MSTLWVALLQYLVEPNKHGQRSVTQQFHSLVSPWRPLLRLQWADELGDLTKVQIQPCQVWLGWLEYPVPHEAASSVPVRAHA